MKKMATIIMGVLLLFTMLTGCRNDQTQTQNTNPNVPNPIKKYEGMGEVNKALGFNMIKLPAHLGFVPTAYETISDRIGQLTYADEPSAEPGQTAGATAKKEVGKDLSVTLRMAKGDEDISGIYGVDYGSETIKSIDINVGIYKNTTYIAWWVYDNYSYSVTAQNIDSAVFNSITDALINEMLGLNTE